MSYITSIFLCEMKTSFAVCQNKIRILNNCTFLYKIQILSDCSQISCGLPQVDDMAKVKRVFNGID